MERTRTLKFVSIGLLIQFLVLSDTQRTGVLCDRDIVAEASSGKTISSRSRRNPVAADDETRHFIEDRKCREDLKRLCGAMNNNDDLFILECAQAFKPDEVLTIDEHCQNALWKQISNLTNNDYIERLTSKACGDKIDELGCSSTEKEPGSYLTCLIEKRESVKDPQCLEYIQRLQWIAFSEFKIITPMVKDCTQDIERLKCDRTQSNRNIFQGQMLECLQEHVEKLDPKCRRRIFKVTEMQAESVHLDVQLFVACTPDITRFCSHIRTGNGEIYKCLMDKKSDREMTKKCQDQLLRREKLIAADYKVSKGLAKACRDDIKNYRCRKSLSNDKEIRLAQILLCLESVEKNGSKFDPECQKEMFDHRKLLLADYRLSPELVTNYARDIPKFCHGLEAGGMTIHCLMEHVKTKKTSRVSPECQRALEDIIKETDAGEDWRIDPILRDAYQHVVEVACPEVRGGNARVIYCLMDKLGTPVMLEACETALIQIQYFIARDYKLDPQLYKACKADAVALCSAKDAWADDGSHMDPDVGPLVLPCLYRHADLPQKNMTLKSECVEEIRRVMKQRAISVDLQPEIEEVCLSDLVRLCYDKTARGEEVMCLQSNLDQLKDKCRFAVSNLTEHQAKHVELNRAIMMNCRSVMKEHCDEILRFGKDDGEMMECLINNKNQLDSYSDRKCKAAIEHFQLISLKNYRFTYKFMEACKPFVNRWCKGPTTKPQVIECLSQIVQDDIVHDKQHRILKDCRQQLRAQLYQQRENIHYDPVLQNVCTQDINMFCRDIEPGNSRTYECLADHKAKLSDACRKKLFKVRQQEFLDSSSDFVLINECRPMIRQFCFDERDKSKVLECLKKAKDDPLFDETCKNIVLKRMIEQSTDFRFNAPLESACTGDINSFCREIYNDKLSDKELEGKVINCLKMKFREETLSNRCEKQMKIVLRQAAQNYRLNPVLVKFCAEEIQTLCHADDDGPGNVQECLKVEFNNGNPKMKDLCRREIANMIEVAQADISVDPLLQKACKVDVVKYCSYIAEGNGKHFACLQNAMEDSKKALEPECHNMLSTRIEMFRNAARLQPPDSLSDLVIKVNSSPAKRYFVIVGLTMIGVIFILGLFCGRITRRTMIMKNK